MDTNTPARTIAEKVPPHSMEAEQSLLGSLIIDKDSMIKVADIINREDFYKESHALIYETILELFRKREPIDLLSLGNRLKEKELLERVGGHSYLMTLANSVPTASHVVHYAEIVQRKATLRRLITSATDMVSMGFDQEQDVDALLDQAEQKLFGITQKYIKRSFVHVKDVLDDAMERIHELHEHKGALRGLPTGYTELDNILGGLQRSDLVILAARPSVGKTSLAIDIARNLAVKTKTPVGVFSLEMSKEQLVDRMICAEANVSLWKLRTGNISDHGNDDDMSHIGEALGVLSEAPIYIDDSPNANVMEIRTKARRLQMEHGLGMVVIDYLQLMEARSKGGGSDGRVQEVAEITRALKGIARELNVPVIALSQLSRAVESRSPSIPKLADLRESGSIEQDADVVLFIYRKAMDKSLYNLPDEERNIADIIIAKHRNGPTGQVSLYFHDETTSFKNLALHHTPTPPEYS